MKKILTTITIVLFAVISMSAQKFGHVNSNEILTTLPEVKTAESQLKDYEKQLMEKGQAMVNEYQAASTAYGQKYNSGELSAVQMQQEEAKLQAKGQEIQRYEVEVQQLLTQKKQEIFEPILNKVQTVITQVGEEMGYTMIFDSSNLGIIFSQDSDDLSSVVKQKLGM